MAAAITPTVGQIQIFPKLRSSAAAGGGRPPAAEDFPVRGGAVAIPGRRRRRPPLYSTVAGTFATTWLRSSAAIADGRHAAVLLVQTQGAQLRSSAAIADGRHDS